MCRVVYLAADAPLREVPWDEAAPAFHAGPVIPEEAGVQKQFAKPHLISVGSHEGCACGFQLGEPPETLEPEEREAQSRSLHALATYLRQELARVGSLELYACWEGEQESGPEHRRTLTPAMIESDAFYFLDKELSTVTADA